MSGVIVAESLRMLTGDCDNGTVAMRADTTLDETTVSLPRPTQDETLPVSCDESRVSGVIVVEYLMVLSGRSICVTVAMRGECPVYIVEDLRVLSDGSIFVTVAMRAECGVIVV